VVDLGALTLKDVNDGKTYSGRSTLPPFASVVVEKA
jgi:hypothetical protein